MKAILCFDRVQSFSEKREDGKWYKAFEVEKISDNLCKRKLPNTVENYWFKRKYKPVHLIHIPTGFCIAEITPSEVKSAVKLFESMDWYLIENNTALQTKSSNGSVFTIHSQLRYEIIP